MGSTVEIVGGRLSPAALRDALTPYVEGVEVRLDVERAVAHRGLPGTELLVAYVGGGAAALSALISGVFALLAARRGEEEAAGGGDRARIRLQGADGSSVECPADATREELDHLVELARRLSSSTMELP